MRAPVGDGKAWFIYRKLEDEFLETARYVAHDRAHEKVWSEKFGELLIRIGSSVGSYFDLMLNSKSLDKEKSVMELRERMKKERQRGKPEWAPNMGHFWKCFNPVFELSTAEVDASYGLTFYGALQPFKDFEDGSRSWWDSHNKLKHEFYEKLDERATLHNVINALAGLFILNVFHKESQRYLLQHTNVINAEYLSHHEIERHLMQSMVGVPKSIGALGVEAATSLFVHIFRADQKVKGGPIYISDDALSE